jgi:hypothetical protein
VARPMTHQGTMRGCDNRTPKDANYSIKLRATANFWIDQHGTRYRKDSGTQPGVSWPMYRLDVQSIKELP